MQLRQRREEVLEGAHAPRPRPGAGAVLARPGPTVARPRHLARRAGPGVAVSQKSVSLLRDRKNSKVTFHFWGVQRLKVEDGPESINKAMQKGAGRINRSHIKGGFMLQSSRVTDPHWAASVQPPHPRISAAQQQWHMCCHSGGVKGSRLTLWQDEHTRGGVGRGGVGCVWWGASQDTQVLTPAYRRHPCKRICKQQLLPILRA